MIYLIIVILIFLFIYFFFIKLQKIKLSTEKKSKNCKGKWSRFSPCPEKCIKIGEKAGVVSRQYIVDKAETNGGKCSLQGKIETSNCPINYCPISCEGKWSSFETCPESCIFDDDKGPVVRRVFQVNKEALYGGNCDLLGKIETSNCPVNNCSTE